MGIKVFYLEATDRQRCWMRRFLLSEKHTCTAKPGWCCDARFEIGEADIRYTADSAIDVHLVPAKDDPRWPQHCAACGKAFDRAAEYQVLTRQIYLNAAHNIRCTLEEAPPGACWDAWWVSDRADRKEDRRPGVGTMLGDDGRSLVVRCPDGQDWMIDSRASNCTMKDDVLHHCWIRHGSPEAGDLHVDKNGNTCAAGAGSIQTANWHGFLRNGELVT